RTDRTNPGRRNIGVRLLRRGCPPTRPRETLSPAGRPERMIARVGTGRTRNLRGIQRGLTRMSHPFVQLEAMARKPPRTVVGLTSRTSADSSDLAVCRMHGQAPEVEVLHYAERPLDPGVKRQVREASRLDVRAVAELHVRVGEQFAEACLATLNEAGLSPD